MTYDETSDRVIGKYRIIASLGEGGMGSVYLGVLGGGSGFHKLMVLKLLRSSLAHDQEIVRMFLQEARVAARLNHPNIVQTVEVGEDAAHARYLVMEYLDGQSLNRIVGESGRRGSVVPIALHLRVLSDALAGLHYAHEYKDFDGTAMRIVHRDISPHNVFVTYEGQVKVIDFGIAKTALDDVLTSAGVVKGKMGYMAPEQVAGTNVDRRADIYAIGVMLWEALTGKRMRKGSLDISSMHALLSVDAVSPRTVSEDCPPELERICLKALARDRDARYATALEFQTDIENYMASAGLRTSMREIGAFVAEQFAAERADLGGRIERRTKQALSIPVPAEVEGDETRILPADVDTSTNLSSVRTEAGPVANNGARRLIRYGVVGGCAIVATLSVLVALRASRVRPAAATPFTTPTAVTSEAATTPSRPTEHVRVEITTTPPRASIYVDDVLAGEGAYAQEVARDSTRRRVRVEAPDHLPQVREVTFDRDLSLAIVLAAKAPSPSLAPTPTKPRVGAAAFPKPTSAAPPEAPKTSPHQPSGVRPLDPNLPWQ